jgi:hypothetical protein
MTTYEQRPDYVALKRTWLGNIAWLLFIAMIVGTSIFVLVTK